MKKKLFFTIALFWCMFLSFGQSIYYNGLNYIVTSTVSPLTASVGSYDEFISTANIESTVNINGNNYAVTSIRNYGFLGCRILTSLTIPNSVTSIGVGCFRDCLGLTSITIPNTVTSIGNDCFRNCSGLTSFTIPNSITNIGTTVFSNCTGLSSVIIPNSITSIGEYAFNDCIGLTSVNIPNSVTSIGNSAFYGCSGLTSLSIPNLVTSINGGVFYGCSGLTSLTIPSLVTSIGISAFQNCTGLTSLTIPNSVTSIGWNAFNGCSGLTSLTIPNSVTGSIGLGTFADCSGLASINIPNSVTSIGYAAFSGCSGLTSLNIPNSVTSIDTAAFGGCSGLTSLNIPYSVTSIGTFAFSDCTGLTAVTVNWSTPLTVNANTFLNVPIVNVKLYVPAGTQSAYASAPVWSNFNIILPLTATQSQTNVSCFGGSDGSATVTPSGGTAPYTYLWSNGTTTATLVGVPSGSYSVTITDAIGFTRSVTGIIVTQSTIINNSVSQALSVVTASQNGATYQWYQCPSTLIPGETNQNYAPTAAGDYKVNVTLSGCTVTSSCVTVTTLGDQNFEFSSNISVYPNPSGDMFSINSDTRGSIVIYDLIGKTIKSENIDLGITKLDLSKYPSGIYFMKVTNDKNQTKNIKLIKQ